MALQLQAIPRGFLSMLGVKAGGNPGQGAEFVQPTLNMEHLYLVDSIDSAQVVQAAATNTGDAATLTVPTGEAWRLIGLCYHLSQPSAVPVTPRVGLLIADPKNQLLPVQVNPASDFAALATLGDQSGGGVLFPQPLVFPPGTAFQAYLFNDLGAITVDIRIRATFHRLVV